jgi:hypothetical protein
VFKPRLKFKVDPACIPAAPPAKLDHFNMHIFFHLCSSKGVSFGGRATPSSKGGILKTLYKLGTRSLISEMILECMMLDTAHVNFHSNEGLEFGKKLTCLHVSNKTENSSRLPVYTRVQYSTLQP